MERFKSPWVLATLAGALLAIVGGFMGWFTIGLEIAAELAEDDLAEKITAAQVAAGIALLFVIAAAQTGKKALATLGVLAALYGALVTFNQLPTADEAEALEVTTNAGYWLSLAGLVITTIGSILVGVLGFGSNSSASEATPAKEADIKSE